MPAASDLPSSRESSRSIGHAPFTETRRPDLSAGRIHVLASDPTANRSLVIGTRPVFEFAAKFVKVGHRAEQHPRPGPSLRAPTDPRKTCLGQNASRLDSEHAALGCATPEANDVLVCAHELMPASIAQTAQLTDRIRGARQTRTRWLRSIPFTN